MTKPGFHLGVLLLVIVFCSGSSAVKDKRDGHSDRKGRLFSVFNVVTFKHASCTSATDTSVRGTCMSSSECSSASGSNAGTCASGFGVCCFFQYNTCSDTVNQNCSYIANPDYPNAYSTAGSCAFTFGRICDDLCQIRLDFDTMTLAQPPTTGANIVGRCATSGDYLTVASPTGQNPPVVCGTLSGQHMFLETALTGTNAGTATFTIGTTGTTTRSWRIKVTYYRCSDMARAPENCVQYLTGVSGNFQSYNYQGGQLIEDNIYTTCIRQETGYCSITYTESGSTSPRSFELYYNDATAANTASPEVAHVLGGTECSSTYIQIAADNPAAAGIFCGGVLNTVHDNTIPGAVTSSVTPFTVDTVFVNTFGDATSPQRAGYSLNYVQNPC